MPALAPPTFDRLNIVDPRPEDYDALASHPALRLVRIAKMVCGDEALIAISSCAPTLWIVNVRLPDMSGVDLTALIRRRRRRSNIYLVGDAYSRQDELAARLVGATAYLCKPVSPTWLSGRLPLGSSLAGPIHARSFIRR